MTFISILIVLSLMQYWGSAKPLQQDAWFDHWYKLCQSIFRQELLLFLSVTLVPAIGLSLVIAFFGYWGWGFLELILSVVVLMYSLGRGDFNLCFERYEETWRELNKDQLILLLQKMDAEYVPHVDSSIEELHVEAREIFLYAGFTRIFVVLFWFSILGPSAALFYRLIRLFEEKSEENTAPYTRAVMEWPAGRVYGVTTAFVGDFGKSIAVWLTYALDMGKPTRVIIDEISVASLGMDMSWQNPDSLGALGSNERLEIAISEMKSIQHLIKRCLVFAVVGIALFQVIA